MYEVWGPAALRLSPVFIAVSLFTRFLIAKALFEIVVQTVAFSTKERQAATAMEGEL